MAGLDGIGEAGVFAFDEKDWMAFQVRVGTALDL